MIPNKALWQLQVDKDAEKKAPKKTETVKEFLARGKNIDKYDRKGKLIRNKK